MPIIRYTFQHPEGHNLTETDYFKYTKDNHKAVEERLKGIAKAIIKVEVLNPFIHEHDYTNPVKSGERRYYVCSRCGCEAYETLDFFKGWRRNMDRTDAWKSSKHEYCRDPLKPMPKSNNLF